MLKKIRMLENKILLYDISLFVYYIWKLPFFKVGMFEYINESNDGTSSGTIRNSTPAKMCNFQLFSTFSK